MPGPVMRPGFGATTRRTSGDSALGTPGVRRGGAATGSSSFTYDTPSAASRASVADVDVGERDRPPSRLRRVVAGEHDALASGVRDDERAAARRHAAHGRARRRTRPPSGSARAPRDSASSAGSARGRRGALTQRVDRAHPGGRDQLAVVVHTVLAVGRAAPRRTTCRSGGARRPASASARTRAAHERRRRDLRSRAPAPNVAWPAFNASRHACERVDRTAPSGADALARGGSRPPRSTRAPPRRGSASPPAANPSSPLAARSSRPATRSLGVRVGRVDCAAREHGRTGTEHRPWRSAQHEDVQVGTIGERA